jgi:hypothetical protein
MADRTAESQSFAAVANIDLNSSVKIRQSELAEAMKHQGERFQIFLEGDLETDIRI